MGLPAPKHDSRRVASRPHLRLVAPAKKSKTGRKRGKAIDPSVARRNFQLFAIVVTTVAVLSIGRVWLSVQATETSLQASSLRDTIRSERYEGDMLEVRQSALGSPSRIRTIAGKAMGMAPANTVTYLDLTTKATRRPVARTEPARAGGSSLRNALARVIDLTAGEAQVLLVGDVGLTSSR